MLSLPVAVAAWLVAASAPVPAPAPPPPADASGGITLEELLDTVVWIASKRDEQLATAPASITAYRDEDLRTLGATTLYDLATFTPGWSGSVIYGEKILETRGQKGGGFNNNKHLVLYDGIPVSHARNYKAPIDEELPLDFAGKVEFLRGPASALYGTSAFFGVVNVTPREVEEGTRFGLRFGLGSHHAERRVSAAALHADALGRFRLVLGHHDRNASAAFVGQHNDPRNLYWDDQKALFFNATYQLSASPLAGAALGIIYMRRSGGLGESWLEQASSHRINDLAWETILPYLKYRRALGDALTFDAWALYNTSRETGWWTQLADPATASPALAPLVAYDTQVDAIQADVQATARLGERALPLRSSELTLGLGIDTRQRRGPGRSYSYAVGAELRPPLAEDPAFATRSDRFSIYSAYLQLRQELPVLAGLILTLGAREDVGRSREHGHHRLSPRAGLVQRLDRHFALRAFYGTALRAPGIKEVGLNRESRATLVRMGQPSDGVPALEAETLRSFELGPIFSNRRLTAAVTGFHNRTAQALDTEIHLGQQIFRNSPAAVTAIGAEIEAEVALARQLRLLANYAWAHARRQTRDVPDVPVQKANAALLYQRNVPALPLRASLVARWIDAYRVSDTGPRPPGALHLDLGVGAGIGALVHPGLPLELALMLRNLGDARGKLPKNGRPDVPVLGRRLLVTLGYGL